jgi:hypothetical protein
MADTEPGPSEEVASWPPPAVAVKATATLSAVVIRADGTVEDLGVISVEECDPAEPEEEGE